MIPLQVVLLLALSSLSSISTATQVEPDDSSIPYNTYRLYTAEGIGTTLREWQTNYPDLIQVYTSQQVFDLPTAGDSSDCPFDTGVTGCLNHYAVVQDYVTHPEGSASGNRLPTVLLSGALHGDERVGPTSVMEATRLLLEAAQCESLPRYTTDDDAQFKLDGEKAETCQDTLSRVYGIAKDQRQWMARLVKTRRLIVVPTANALGYHRNDRQEGQIDPNRDFPYDLLDPTQCMQSIAARTLNELFRKYLITNSFTFHAGTELLGWEWGNPSWYGKLSPDDVAQSQLAKGYVTYGGSFVDGNGQDHPNYEYGDMNSVIYYVRGGFEDFAYAGSWDHDRMLYCKPNTFGGYDPQKTTYDDGMLRSFNMLVETSWSKDPSSDELGTTWNVLFENSDASGLGSSQRNLRRRQANSERTHNGHIPRNLRLSVAAIDLVQPYLRVLGVDKVMISDDAVPLQETSNGHVDCKIRATLGQTAEQLITQALDTGHVPVVSTSLQSNPTIRWSVGGVIAIDETDLWVAVLNDAGVLAPNGAFWLSEYSCGNRFQTTTSAFHRLDATTIQSSFVRLGEVQTGTGFFSTDGAQPTGEIPQLMGPIFSTKLDLTALNVTKPTTLIIVAGAKVDGAWTKLPDHGDVGPTDTNPQSHMVQARTNDAWAFESQDGYVIQGQSQWFSNPILLHLVDDADATTLHHNDRTQHPSERPELSNLGQEPPSQGSEADIIATSAPSTVDGTIDPDTMDPTTLDSLTSAPTEPVEQTLQINKQDHAGVEPNQSIADALRMYKRLYKDQVGAQPQGGDLGGGNRRRQQEMDHPGTHKKARERFSRASPRRLQDLPPRP